VLCTICSGAPPPLWFAQAPLLRSSSNQMSLHLCLTAFPSLWIPPEIGPWATVSGNLDVLKVCLLQLQGRLACFPHYTGRSLGINSTPCWKVEGLKVATGTIPMGFAYLYPSTIEQTYTHTRTHTRSWVRDQTHTHTHVGKRVPTGVPNPLVIIHELATTYLYT
jgi:hypothetical protein